MPSEMSARTLFWSACSVCCLVSLLGACAEGVGLDDDGDQDSQDVAADAGTDDVAVVPPRRDAATGSSSSSSSSSGEEATSSSSSSTSSGGGSSSSSSSTGGSSSSSSSSSSSGGSSSSSSSSSGGSSSGSGPYVCEAAATCAATPSQTSVSGDEFADTFSVTGSRSQWVHFRLVEDDHWDDDLYLSAQINFTGAPGATYQLNVRSNCAVSNPLVIAPGAIIKVDDSGYPDDSKDIWVEVKQLSGACPTVGTWKLKVTGNQ